MGVHMKIIQDYNEACNVTCGFSLKDGYSKIKFKTDEDLVKLYRNVDFMDKRVLSVLESADEVFMARYLGAKKVDFFSNNKLAIYYYYLRVWTVKYMNQVYPEQLLINDHVWLTELLDKVTPADAKEEMALSFWKKHSNDRSDLSSLFILGDNEGRTIFKSTNSLSGVVDDKSYLKDYDFYSESDDEVRKKNYDIIIFSDYMKYAISNSNGLRLVSNNLYDFVSRKGVVLCSHFDHDETNEIRQFDYNGFSHTKLGENLGYLYRRY